MNRVACAVALLCCLPAGARADGAAFRGGPERTGAYEGAGVPLFHGVKWRFHTGAAIISSPAVVDGTVYVGSNDHALYAIDAASGKQKWKLDTRSRVTSSPAVADGTVFFGSYDGLFYAVDAASGALRWKVATGGERRYAGRRLHGSDPTGETMPDPFDVFLSSPVVWHGAVYDPIVHNQVGIQSTAAAAGGMVFFGCRDSKLYALDAKTGEKKWAFDNHGSWVVGSPAVRDGRVFFATSDSGMFYALDAATGAEIFSLSSNKWPMFSSPALAGGFAYVGTDEGKLLAIDLSRQTLAWSYQTDASKQYGPTYTKPDGTPNYAAAFTDSFYDDMVAGVVRMQSIGQLLSSPVVVGDVIYVGSTDGDLYALE